MKRYRIVQWLFITLMVVAGSATAEPVKLMPVDEAAADPTWARFRARLIDAVLKHDQKFVLSIIERNVRNISGVDGAVEFRKLWEINDPEGPLWSELPKVMFLGSANVKTGKIAEVCAPYVYFRWPTNAPDDSNAAVIAKEALLKSGPSAASATLQTLSYDLVIVSDWEAADQSKDNKQLWVAIRTPGGAGYLPQEQVRSPLEYRACFVKRDGNWRLSGLEVGE